MAFWPSARRGQEQPRLRLNGAGGRGLSAPERSYDCQFGLVAGGTFTDSGSSACH